MGPVNTVATIVHFDAVIFLLLPQHKNRPNTNPLGHCGGTALVPSTPSKNAPAQRQ